MPGSGLGTEGAWSPGTAAGLSPELTGEEGRLGMKRAAGTPGGVGEVPEKARCGGVVRAGTQESDRSRFSPWFGCF